MQMRSLLLRWFGDPGKKEKQTMGGEKKQWLDTQKIPVTLTSGVERDSNPYPTIPSGWRQLFTETWNGLRLK